ncbi:type II toxin-antitoxin system RatA family toxin [Leeia sp. TBRC 13508]|uniref:Type II toxin-antitoxin system RatA family toxin n=1 Tax=Leeia speluncae TaxID=2884804 RepID=A0ABS8D2C3_9NEIS|nr:type II toxin-antitoxin system RatA family toxin [Leeia speluncae]MCB6182126.1 type II toxin-antitoxin system RatA family toxin [Leeia speluncae]
MIKVEQSVLVEHTAEQMYRLVEQIEEYPNFLPWCSGSSVTSRSNEETVGTLHMNYHGVKSHFTTQNKKIPFQKIDMALLDGQFKTLSGSWFFTPLGEDACKVELKLQYQFSSTILEKLIGPVFNRISHNLVEAFVERADSIYKANQ